MLAPRRNVLQQGLYLAGLYGMYIRLYYRELAEYRIDTWVALIAGMLAQTSSLLFLSIIFGKIPSLNGWGFYELLFIFSIAVTGRALNMSFLNVPFSMSGLIQSGQLDVLMIRPVGPFFQATAMRQDMNGLGSVFTGLVIMFYAASNLQIDWTVGKILYLAVALLSSMFIMLGLWLLVTTLAFWVLEVKALLYPVSWMVDFTRYPLEIFHPFVRGLLTYVLPYAFGTFYPAAFLLRPHEYAWVGWIVPAVAVVLMLLTYRLWLFGLKRYSSVNN